MTRCLWPNCRGVMFALPPDPDVRYFDSAEVPEASCLSCGRTLEEPIRLDGPVKLCNRLGCLAVAGASGLCRYHAAAERRRAAAG